MSTKKTYAEVQRAVYARLTNGGIKLSVFPKSMQPVVLRMVDQGKLQGTRLVSGDWLIEK